MNMVTYEDKLAFIEKCRDDPVFFVENILKAPDGKPYKLEEHQKQFLRCQHPYRQLFWARRMSKTTTLTFDILHKAIFTPSLKILGVLPSQSQADDVGSELHNQIERSEYLLDLFKKINVTKLVLKNGSTINLATAGGEGFSQLGRGARYLFFDEAQLIPQHVYGILIPILRGQPGEKWMVYSGTPLGRQGRFWEIYRDAKMYIKPDGIHKEPETKDHNDFIVFQRPTAILDENGKIIDTGTWRIKPEELEADRRQMGEQMFLREYCLQWMDNVGQVFPQDIVDNMMRRTSTPIHKTNNECYVGVDIGKARNNSVITIGESHGDHLHIINIITFPLNTQYETIINYIIGELPRSYPNIRKCVLDATGVGAPVAEQINRAAPFPVEPYVFGNTRKKQELVEAGALLIESGKVTSIYNHHLYSEMLNYQREITDKGTIRYAKPGGGTDDHIDSLLLCIRGFQQTPQGNRSFDIVNTGSSVLKTITVGANPLKASTNKILKRRGILR